LSFPRRQDQVLAAPRAAVPGAPDGEA
jgi:hypothetical protein